MVALGASTYLCITTRRITIIRRKYDKNLYNSKTFFLFLLLMREMLLFL